MKDTHTGCRFFFFVADCQLALSSHQVLLVVLQSVIGQDMLSCERTEEMQHFRVASRHNHNGLSQAGERRKESLK